MKILRQFAKKSSVDQLRSWTIGLQRHCALNSCQDCRFANQETGGCRVMHYLKNRYPNISVVEAPLHWRIIVYPTIMEPVNMGPIVIEEPPDLDFLKYIEYNEYHNIIIRRDEE